MTWALILVLGLSIASIWTLPIFGGVIFVCRKVSMCLEDTNDDIYKKKVLKVTLAISVFLGFFVTFGDNGKMLENLENALFRIIILVIAYLGMVLLIRSLLILLYVYMNRVKPETVQKSTESFFYRHIFSLSAGVSFLCYLPFFLYEYPGILTPDSINQLEQAMGVIEYSNHHPWMHTLCIEAIVRPIFNLTGNMNLSVACYTLFQMILFSLAVGYFVSTLYKVTKSRKAGVIALIFFAVVPFNAIMAITMWKDIIFSLAVVTLICSLIRLVATNIKTQISDYILFSLAIVVMSLFRSNGWFAFLGTAPFILYLFRKKKLPIWIIVIGAIIVSLVVKGPVMNYFNVSQPDFVESVAMPIQMVSRVLVENKEVPKEQLEEIEKVMDLTYISDIYCEFCADNMKELVRAGHPQYLAEHKGDFLKIWFSLGMKYPGTYFDAWVGQTRAYWYPEVYYTIAEAEGVSRNELGIYSDPILRGSFFVKLREIWVKLGNMIPGYGMLWGLGSTFWLILIALGYSLTKSNKEWILYVPLLMLFGTLMIATPLGLEFRYVYYNSLALPVLLIYSFVSPKEESNGSGTCV